MNYKFHFVPILLETFYFIRSNKILCLQIKLVGFALIPKRARNYKQQRERKEKPSTVR